MTALDNVSESAQDREYLKNLKEWAAGREDLYVPELIMASTFYSGEFEDELIEQLMTRLYEVEKRPRIWLQYAHSILPVYKKAKNNEIKLKLLNYIYNHNEKIAISWQTNCNPVIKGTGRYFHEELPSEIERLIANL